MAIVLKFGTFWLVYCPVCAWQSGPEAGAWQDAETVRGRHVCAPEVLIVQVSPRSMGNQTRAIPS